MVFDWSKTICQCSSGMPIISQMIRSGRRAAASVTKSHGPVVSRSPTTSPATRSTASSSSLTRRGVKPDDTMERSLLWRGSSIEIIDPK